MSRSLFVFEEVGFWRSYELLNVSGIFVAKKFCLRCAYFWGAILGEGVKESIRVEILDLAPKKPQAFGCSLYPSTDMMTWQYDDMAVRNSSFE